MWIRPTTSPLLRSAVAFFNMKHFQVKQKIKVNPSNVCDVFSQNLLPGDRLLRQSSAGAGATRVLVLNRNQMVKAVYLPILCLPHPAAVSDTNTVLGLSVEQYLSTVKTSLERKHTTFMALSHPKGIAFTVYDSMGSPKMPIVKVAYSDAEEDSDIARGIGKHALDTAGTPNRSRAIEFLKALGEHMELVEECDSFYMINRERGSCLMLGDIRRLTKPQDPDEEVVTGFEGTGEPMDYSGFSVFEEKGRWHAVPEQALQTNPEAPLYIDTLPNDAGLHYSVSTGVLLLDFKKKGASQPVL